MKVSQKLQPIVLHWIHTVVMPQKLLFSFQAPKTGPKCAHNPRKWTQMDVFGKYFKICSLLFVKNDKKFVGYDSAHDSCTRYGWKTPV